MREQADKPKPEPRWKGDVPHCDRNCPRFEIEFTGTLDGEGEICLPAVRALKAKNDRMRDENTLQSSGLKTAMLQARDRRGEIERLREIMRKGCAMVEACGHTKTCKCCWCALRKLMAEAAEAGKDGAE